MGLKDTYFSNIHSLNLCGNLVSLSDPLIMGILNITPDSFYDGGRYNSSERILDRVNQIVTGGGDIIDVGAYSSRPGAVNISEKEEGKRLFPVLDLIRKNYPDVTISVDTFRSGIAVKAINDYKIDMINDISAGNIDNKLIDVIVEKKVPYILMHMLGNPGTMQDNPVYKDVVGDLVQFFAKKIARLHTLGVNDIIVDPGFGFGKTLAQNYDLLQKLDIFKILNKPILVGLSRKSMITKVLGLSPDNALNGTTALHAIALQKGANIFRVHDVKEAKQCIILMQKLHGN